MLNQKCSTFKVNPVSWPNMWHWVIDQNKASYFDFVSVFYQIHWLDMIENTYKTQIFLLFDCRFFTTDESCICTRAMTYYSFEVSKSSLVTEYVESFHSSVPSHKMLHQSEQNGYSVQHYLLWTIFLNSLCAIFFSINMYLWFLTFLHTDMTEVVETLLYGRQKPD